MTTAKPKKRDYALSIDKKDRMYINWAAKLEIFTQRSVGRVVVVDRN